MTTPPAGPGGGDEGAAEKYHVVPGHWRVLRWGGRRTDKWRVVFSGSQEEAERRFHDEYVKMRQGKVRMESPSGKQYSEAFAPNLRTAW